jgi:hypothetical protein
MHTITEPFVLFVSDVCVAPRVNKLTFYGEIHFNHENPINRRVIAEQLVTNASSQVTFTHVKYRCPNTGLEYEFVINHIKYAKRPSHGGMNGTGT